MNEESTEDRGKESNRNEMERREKGRDNGGNGLVEIKR